MVASSYSLLHADLPVCIGYGAAGNRVDTRRCLLPARADSVSAARRFVRDVSAHWERMWPGRMETVLDNLGIVVSELVTNALLHAYSAVGAVLDDPDDFEGLDRLDGLDGLDGLAALDGLESRAASGLAAAPGPEAGRISLCLIHELCGSVGPGVERVVFAVADPSVEAPVAPDPARSAGGLWGLCESGRGMTLVEALADDWGWRRVRPHGGAEPAGKVVWALFELAC